jgi:hypothetical protein
MPKMLQFFIMVAIMTMMYGFSRTISLIIWFIFIFSIVIYWYAIKMESKQEEKLKKVCLLLIMVYFFSQLIPYDITFRYTKHVQNKSITVLPIVGFYGTREKIRKLEEDGEIRNQDFVVYNLKGTIFLVRPRYAIVIYIH